MEFPRSEARGQGIHGENDLVFQVLDWYVPETDKAARKLPRPQETSGAHWKTPPPPYEIVMYGSTAQGKSVTVTVSDYEPYFYVKPPKSWNSGNVHGKIDDLKYHLINTKTENPRTGQMRYQLPYRMRSHFVHIEPVEKHDFWGFTNGERFLFLEVKVKSLALFNVLKRYFEKRTDFKLYESNIDPFLRFIHERNIRPCGWVRIPRGTYTVIDPDEEDTEEESNDSNSDVSLCTEQPTKHARTEINVKAQCDDVHSADRASIAPLLIASFDIECTSSHGDFPVARKDYRKLAVDLVAAAKAAKAVDPSKLAKWIYKAFKEGSESPKIHKVFPKQQSCSEDDINKLKSTICNEEFLSDVARLVTKAMRNLKTVRKQAAGDAADAADAADGDEDAEPWSAVERDAAESELNAVLTRNLPPLKGDPIIQIGTTVHRYGSDQIVYRHIGCLGSCDPIENADVECYKTEAGLIEGWKNLIERLDPDILTGYNIFGFDFKYLWERAKELGIHDEMGIGIGRLRDRKTTLIEERLSSSALGDNFFYYIDMDGVVLIDMLKVMQRDHKLDSYKLDAVAEHILGDRKNDLSPNEIFQKFGGTSTDRADIARYCLQDCALVNRLIDKLKVLENNIGMGNVCSVPLSYLFMRGQGVKIFSLVAAECRMKDTLIPVVRMPSETYDAPPDESQVGYEGAIVLEPQTGIYMDKAITVFDYASLYPSSMISRDLSHDRYVLDPQYANIEGVEYKTVSFDVYSGVGDKKVKTGESRCTFAQAPNGQKGIIPSILDKLLSQRKNTRKKIEYKTVSLKDGKEVTGLATSCDNGDFKLFDVDLGTTTHIASCDVAQVRPTYNQFEQAVLDALQLAYKITANSLYGQIGSKTSPIYLKEIAACTTATGREMIMYAKEFMETNYGGQVIYGDTDSLFVSFSSDATDHKGKVEAAIAAGQRASKAIKNLLPPPQCLEYEKTFYPFILFTKKRYVGNLYEDDANKKPKQKSMGIVLKRRDNAPIVKKVYGGIIDMILNKHDLPGSVDFLKRELQALVDGNVAMEDLIISKTLRAEYKDPTKIAHKVLADRMGLRDAGNKPQANDRIPFVYIKHPEGTESPALQGDRIEHPDFIRANGLRPDYLFYITNQLMKPISQLYALCVNQLPGYDHPDDYWLQWDENLRGHKLYGESERKRQDRILAIKMQAVEALLFEPYIVMLGGVKRRMPKPSSSPKSRPMANQAKLENALCVCIEVIEHAAKKETNTKAFYSASAALIPPGEWELKETYPKKAKVTKEQVYRSFSEQVLMALYAIPEYKARMENDGLHIKIPYARFVNLWNAAIVSESERMEKYKQAIANQDMGLLKDLTTQNVFSKLLDAGEAITYIVTKQ